MSRRKLSQYTHYPTYQPSGLHIFTSQPGILHRLQFSTVFVLILMSSFGIHVKSTCVLGLPTSAHQRPTFCRTQACTDAHDIPETSYA
ncbi:predicted protein [Plenodomus lingam JN3]|uniref:Predicted protein n=1 Tax=Leptosphaeria maculans (strain JN3 / isolate v23.1.3 / race Av1-4-5-6-7-8) TaxID=985895 RepID=E4ZU36_LEPMJ|nr:predicted protein [Plenodomus lingam JN3]CBX94746.1 predicted protein [Plenodomus lingam JN3]